MEQDSKLNNPLNTTDLSDFSKIESEKKKEKALKRKWFVLAVFFILSFTNGGAWGTYAAIVDRTKEYYGISSHQVLWFTWEYYITYVIFTFIGSTLLGKSLVFAIFFGAILNSVGAWLRYIAFGKYFIALIGQVLISVSTNVMLPAPNSIANDWFDKKEKFMSITIGCLANSLGVGVGFLFSPAIVGEESENIKNLLFIEAICMTIPLLLCAIVIRKSPNSYKIEPVKKIEKNKKNDSLKDLKLLFKNRKYVLTVLAFGINNGNCWTMLGIIDVFLSDSFSSFLVGIIGLVFILSGVTGSFIGTFFLKYIPNSEKHFDKLIKFLFLISTLSYIALSVFVSFAPYSYLLLIAIVFQGLGSLGLQPFECKALEEIAYPVKASLSVNGLFFMTCLLGFPISFISTIDVFGVYGIWALTISLIPFSIYIIFFYKTEFRNMEKNENNESLI